MTTLQLVLAIVVGVLSIVSVVFMIMFIVEMKAEDEFDTVEVKSIFSSDNYTSVTSDSQVNNMLANLDKQAEEVVEESQAPAQINQVINIVVADTAKEEPAQEPIEVETEPVNEEPVITELNVEEVLKEEEPVVQTEVVEEEPAQEPIEEQVQAEAVEEVSAETEVVEIEENTQEEVQVIDESVETISPEKLLDYKARLENVMQNRNKIEKDLIKLQKAILNYERTKRRKSRNQKMLDRRASELTNLNLIMYSVTDIKNVDEDKKIKQEELTAHIAELKASIQDADEFLDSNKEKNEHNIKMAKFLLQEKNRYSEEISELEKLIRNTEDTNVA